MRFWGGGRGASRLYDGSTIAKLPSRALLLAIAQRIDSCYDLAVRASAFGTAIYLKTALAPEQRIGDPHTRKGEEAGSAAPVPCLDKPAPGWPTLPPCIETASPEAPGFWTSRRLA